MKPTPSARLSPERGLALGPRWGWQPKVDGVLCQGRTDDAGRIVYLFGRTGAPISEHEADGLYGLHIGLPNATLWGELEASTEAGIRARELRGWPAWHLFDIERVGGESLASRTFLDRYLTLFRWHVYADAGGVVPEDLSWWRDRNGRARSASSMRFVRAVPQDLRRVPVVPLVRHPSDAEQLWRKEVEIGGGEGLVAVRLDAPFGVRGSKAKIKTTQEIDATVIARDKSTLTVVWGGQPFVVSATSKAGQAAKLGDVVEIKLDGWYDRGVVPKFARVTRVRGDLAAPH